MKLYQNSQPLLPFFIVFCVVFNNLKLTNAFIATDLIYTLFMVLILYKSTGVKFDFYARYSVLVMLLCLSIIIVNFFRYEHFSGVMSQLRFFWGVTLFTILYFYYSSPIRRRSLIDYYLFFVKIASLFIILQSILFYIVGVNIYFTFGEFNYFRVTSEGVIPGSGLLRSGGFFREPSWYAIFALPAFYDHFSSKRNMELAIVGIGLFLSTSSLSIIYIAIIFLHSIFVNFSFTVKKKSIYLSIVFSLLLTYLYFEYSILFERLLFAMETGGSISIRFFEPFSYIDSHLTAFGSDITFIKGDDKNVFVNTGLFIVFSFGVIGLLILAPIVFGSLGHINVLVLCVAITIFIEGLHGRVDFWLFLLIIRLITLEQIFKRGSNVV